MYDPIIEKVREEGVGLYEFLVARTRKKRRQEAKLMAMRAEKTVVEPEKKISAKEQNDIRVEYFRTLPYLDDPEVQARMKWVAEVTADWGNRSCFAAPPEGVKAIRILKIVSEVCAATYIAEADLLGGRRFKPIVAARNVIVKRAFYETVNSTCQIGRTLNIDHTTVLFHLSKIYGRQYTGEVR